MLVRPSSSASVADPATGKALNKSEHGFVVIDDPSKSKALPQRPDAIGLGQGQRQIGRIAGAEEERRRRCRRDRSTSWSVQRSGWSMWRRRNPTEVDRATAQIPRYWRSGVLCAADLIAYADLHAPEAQFKTLIEAAKRKPEFVAKRKEVMAAYRTDHIERGWLAASHGRWWRRLSTRWFAPAPNRRATGCGRSCRRTTRFIGTKARRLAVWTCWRIRWRLTRTVCADPIEGMDYKTKNCGYILITEKQINIYSQAHGGAMHTPFRCPTVCCFKRK